MKTIFILIRQDWLQIRRSRTFWLLCLIFSGISLYAAWYGNNEVKEQQRKIALVKDSVDTQMSRMSIILLKQDSAAWDYEPLYKTILYNKPDGVAALAFGQRDLHKFVIEISEGTYYYNKYATGYTNKTLSGEIVNPQKQSAGHLDMSFVIVFLLPLFLILLSYNILSEEEEGRTLPLLRIHSVSLVQLSAAKLLLRCFITILLSLLLLLIASLITDAISDIGIFIFMAAIVVYTLFWAGVVWLVAAFRKSSGFNALLLSCIWLLLCILLPAGLNAWLAVKYPAVNKIALASTVQKANSDVFAMPRVEVADSFYAMHPQYNNLPGDTLPNGWYNPRWMRSVHAVLDSRVDVLEKMNNAALLSRMQTADRMCYASPALLTQNILSVAAAGNMAQMYAFDTSGWYDFNKWNTYLDNKIFFKNNRFTKADFDALPVFVFAPLIDENLIFFQLICLLVMSGVLMAIGAGLTMRKESV